METTERKRTVTMRFDPGADENAPFRRSLGLILRAAQQEFEATGVCLYELVEPDTLILRNSWWQDNAHNTSARLSSANLQLSPVATSWLFDLRRPQLLRSANQEAVVSDYPETLLHQFRELIVAPLVHDGQLQGIVTVGWRDEQSLPPDWRARLVRLSGILTALIHRSRQATAAMYLASKVAKLESELVDGKIADRAAGILGTPEPERQALAAIEKHVERVLNGPFSTDQLREQVSSLQTSLEDRRILIEAKAVLQRSAGFTEEQAYLYLRNESRRTRTPLREIAHQVLTKQNVTPRRLLAVC